MDTKRAIEKTQGPCIILAGAGTGKTHTIVEKLKYLIKNKIYPPEKIVCITFSNEAANNLLVRIRKSLNLEKEPIIQTFHAFAADLLRQYGDKIEIPKDFQILTPDEAKVLIHRTLRIQPYYCHKYISTISTAKDLGITLESLKDYLTKKSNNQTLETLTSKAEVLQFQLQTLYLKKDAPKRGYILKELNFIKSLLDIKKFINTWEAYEKIKNKQKYQDYSDLQVNSLKLLEKSPEIAINFPYIIVDEFQDTNKIQIDFLKLLSPRGNITVVGDTNQSIYRFRGAYKDNLKLFDHYFQVEKNEIFNLKESYRSPNKVLRNAHKLILNNYEDKSSCFQVENAQKREGENIQVYELKNAKEEARKIVEIIKEELNQGKAIEEMCIIFRTHQQGTLIKRTLENNNIPYSAVSKSSLLKHPAIKTVIDYLTIINSLSKNLKGNEGAWWDLIYQLEFADEDLIKIGKFIKDNKDSENINQVLLKTLIELPLSDLGKLSSKILIERINLLVQKAKLPIKQLLLAIYNLGGIMPSGKTDEEKTLILNLNKFLELAFNHSILYAPDLGSFIHYLEILTNLNIEVDAASLENRGIRLMTLHATKGLEYKTIILTNMAQKRFPMEKMTKNTLLPSEILPELNHLNKLSDDEKEDYLEEYERHNQLLEERRLCYVAFTRSKEKLIITYAKEYANKKFFPSAFLNEIEYLSNPDITFIKDEQELAQEFKEISTKLRFGSILDSHNFEEKLISTLKAQRPKNTQFPDKKVFSPSALLQFTECEKAYEYKYLYNMPDAKKISWESIRLGSFLHRILEIGVKSDFKTLKEFIDKAKEMHLSEDWNSVDLQEATFLIAVFFERNKNKYNKNSLTEKELKTQLGNFKFIGFADRIDIDEEGLEIIDYKTGKTPISPKHRSWQLGFYALAAREIGKVKRITLDMLKQEKPLEFHLDEEGNAIGQHLNASFNIYEVEKELISTAEQIVKAYREGFKPCSPEKNCEFCSEYVYN